MNIHDFRSVRRHYLGLCVSTKPEEWKLPNIPFYCYSEPKYFPRAINRERIDYLADKWNQCHKLGLQYFPDTTHIINIGSHYLEQIEAIKQLINRYEEIDNDVILAGNVWGKFVDKILTCYRTYDTWAYPDLEGLEWRLRPPRGIVQVSSVAMPCIYPVKFWRRHPFHNPESMDDGIWYNQFCKESGLPALCDLDIRFYRTSGDSDIPGDKPVFQRVYRSFLWRVHHEAIAVKNWLGHRRI
jgi:hypothetical protein